MHHFHKQNISSYLGNAVYGALDGTVTTFAVMAGAVGASLPKSVVIILGVASLVADGFSMAVGSYMSERSKKQYLDKAKARTQECVDEHHKHTEEELRQIYKDKGFDNHHLDGAIKILKKNRSVFVEELIAAEGITSSPDSPVLISLITFFAFITVGAAPLIPIIVLPTISFWQIIAFVAVILFLVGSLRSKVTTVSWWKGGLEVSIAGIVASLIAYGIGDWLSSLYIP